MFVFWDTRSHTLRLKCTKFDFRWGSAPDLDGTVYSAPSDPLAKGPTSKGREWVMWKGERMELGGEGKRRGREGKEGASKSVKPMARKVVSPPLITSTRRYCDRACLLVWLSVCLFVSYVCCDFLKTTSLIFMKFGVTSLESTADIIMCYNLLITWLMLTVICSLY